jgi:ketosteroid isomerase-like protein
MTGWLLAAQRTGDVMTDLENLAERVAKLESQLSDYDDRRAISDVLYRYARGADRCDLELFKSCYWPDGTDLHWFFNGNAHEFAEWVIPVLAEVANSQHSITNPIIDLQGDRAFVESQWYVVHHIPAVEGDTERFIDQQIEGRYVDVFEKRQGDWRILHRQVVIESGREFIATPLMPLPEGHPALGQRAPLDVVFQGVDLLKVPVFPVGGMDLWGDARARHGFV